MKTHRVKSIKIKFFIDFLLLSVVQAVVLAVLRKLNFLSSSLVPFIVVLSTLNIIFSFIISSRVNSVLFELKRLIDDFDVKSNLSLDTLNATFETNLLVDSFNRLIGKLNHYVTKAEEAAKELTAANKELLRANEIIEKSSIVVFDWPVTLNTPANFITKNISNYGYTEDDFYSGRVDYYDFIHEDDRERTKELVWGNREKGINDYKHIYRVRCKDGSIRWIEEWSILVRDENGKLICERGILRDITDQKESESRIHHLIYHDDLTGLYNRAYFTEILNKYEEYRESNISIIIGDMNCLKIVNDTYGHKCGDLLLVETAKILKASCRSDDVVARLSGDEFAIVIKGNESAASRICIRIREFIDRSDFRPVKPSIALGYASRKSLDENLDSVFKEADNNMYKDKLRTVHNPRRSVHGSTLHH